MRRRAWGALKAILFVALGTSVLACISASNEPKQVRGLVVDVEASSASQLASFELQTTTGSRIRFHVDGDVGITPGHTREHMLGAEPVTVTYRDTPRGAQAIRVDD